MVGPTFFGYSLIELGIVRQHRGHGPGNASYNCIPRLGHVAQGSIAEVERSLLPAWRQQVEYH